jgi:hypothetical protein
MRMRVMCGARCFMASVGLRAPRAAAWAQSLARAAVALCLLFAAAAVQAQTSSRPFTALRPASGAAAAAYALVVELAPREQTAGVHIALAPAVAPAPGARYVVWVNGSVVADVGAAGGRQILAIAPDAFTPGTNTIQLALAPSGAPVTAALALSHPAPLDDADSSLSIDFAGLRPNPAPTLAQLPLAFDARAWLPHTIAVDLGGDAVTAGQLSAAALAVQGVASRMRQVDIAVTYRSETTIEPWGRDAESWNVSAEDVAAGDMLLVGTRSALSRALPASVERAITGPFVGVYPLNGGKSVAVVISGETDDECVRAAQAFADPSAAWPASPAMVIANSAGGEAPRTRLAMTLAEPDPALVRAALRFAAVRASRTDAIAAVPVRFSSDPSGSNLFLGKDSALSARVRRHLPVYPPLQPGQAVSLPKRGGELTSVAMLGVSNDAVARAVDMLRRPGAWSFFSEHATLIDTRARTMTPLAVATRSPLAQVRLFLADPFAFWSVLAALLLASFVFVNLALKLQVVQRLEAAGRQPSHRMPNKGST